MLHVDDKQFILYQVIYHVQGYSQLSRMSIDDADEFSRNIKKEGFCAVSAEQRDTLLDRGPRHIETNVAGVFGKRQLIAVATAELYDRCYPSKCYKFIEYVSLVMSQMAIGAGS